MHLASTYAEIRVSVDFFYAILNFILFPVIARQN